MTSLEIKRLDTVVVSPPGIDNKRPPISPKSILQERTPVVTINYSKSLSQRDTPINIIKSPSYEFQLVKTPTTPPLKSFEIDDARSTTSPPPANATHTTEPTITSSPTNGRADKNDDSFNEPPNNLGFDVGTLTFNKYGFAELPNNNSVTSPTNTSTSSKSLNRTSSKTNRNSDVSAISSSTNTTNNKNATISKEALQQTDVELFAERLPIKVIHERELKWNEMLNNFDEWMSKRFAKVKSRCRKGIPESMRAKAWMYLTGAFLIKAQKPNYYDDCLLNKANLDVNKYVDDIKKDLHRQFPLHEKYMRREGRMSLFNVLRAYAVHNREVGYCQAQGPIAAVLLMYLPEEDAFWVLVRICDFYLSEYYKPGLERVQVDGQALFQLFKRENLPAYKMLKQQSIDPVLFMTEWFMCIYARTLPWCTVLRVWDMFFCEGIKVIFRVGLHLMQGALGNKRDSVGGSKQQHQQGMYETLNLLKNFSIRTISERHLVKESCLIKVSESDLKKAFDKANQEFAKSKVEMNASRNRYANNNNANNSQKESVS